MTLKQLIRSLRSIEPNSQFSASYIAAKLEGLDDLNNVGHRSKRVRHPRQTPKDIEAKVLELVDSGLSQAEAARRT